MVQQEGSAQSLFGFSSNRRKGEGAPRVAMQAVPRAAPRGCFDRDLQAALNSFKFLSGVCRRTPCLEQNSRSQSESLAAPPAATLRSMFAAAAEALLANRPLRAASTPPVQAGSALSKGELTALAAIGLSTKPWPPGQADDPLTQTIIDYVALIETSLSTAEVARLLQVNMSRIRQRLRERSLLGVEHRGRVAIAQVPVRAPQSAPRARDGPRLARRRNERARSRGVVPEPESRSRRRR